MIATTTSNRVAARQGSVSFPSIRENGLKLCQKKFILVIRKKLFPK